MPRGGVLNRFAESKVNVESDVLAGIEMSPRSADRFPDPFTLNAS